MLNLTSSLIWLIVPLNTYFLTFLTSIPLRLFVCTNYSNSLQHIQAIIQLQCISWLPAPLLFSWSYFRSFRSFVRISVRIEVIRLWIGTSRSFWVLEVARCRDIISKSSKSLDQTKLCRDCCCLLVSSCYGFDMYCPNCLTSVRMLKSYPLNEVICFCMLIMYLSFRTFSDSNNATFNLLIQMLREVYGVSYSRMTILSEGATSARSFCQNN